VLLRGDTDFSQTKYFDRWDDDGVRFTLNNFRRHGEDRVGVARTWKADPFSSGPVFFDWKELEHSPILWPLRETYHPLIVLRPRTWLLAKGWQEHHPLISVWEVPGPRA
jgi:hypothetical protein